MAITNWATNAAKNEISRASVRVPTCPVSISAYPMEGRGHSRKSVSAHLDHSPTHKGTVLVCINVHWRELQPGEMCV